MPSYYCHCRAPRLTEVALRARKIGTYILLAAFFCFSSRNSGKNFPIRIYKVVKRSVVEDTAVALTGRAQVPRLISCKA